MSVLCAGDNEVVLVAVLAIGLATSVVSAALAAAFVLTGTVAVHATGVGVMVVLRAMVVASQARARAVGGYGG